jgi:hypothetical protein
MRRLPVVNVLPVPSRHPVPLRSITRSCARVRLSIVCFRAASTAATRGLVPALLVQGGASAARDGPPPAQVGSGPKPAIGVPRPLRVRGSSKPHRRSSSASWAAVVRTVPSMTRVTIASSAPGPKDLGSGALPGIPCPKDLSCDLVWIRPGDRFELLQPTCEAIGQVQITELIRCDPV